MGMFHIYPVYVFAMELLPIQLFFADVSFLMQHSTLEGLYNVHSQLLELPWIEPLNLPHLREISIKRPTTTSNAVSFQPLSLLTSLTVLKIRGFQAGGWHNSPTRALSSLNTLTECLTKLQVLHLGIESEFSVYHDVGALKSVSLLRSLQCPLAMIDSCSFPFLTSLSVSYGMVPEGAENTLVNCNLPSLSDLSIDASYADKLPSLPSSLIHLTRLDILSSLGTPCPLRSKDLPLPRLKSLTVRNLVDFDADFAQFSSPLEDLSLRLFRSDSLFQSPAVQTLTRLEALMSHSRNLSVISSLTRLESLTVVLQEDKEKKTVGLYGLELKGTTELKLNEKAKVSLSLYASSLSRLRSLSISPAINLNELSLFPCLFQLELPDLHLATTHLTCLRSPALTSLTVQSLKDPRADFVRELRATLPRLNVTIKK
jgi:hypothetical protein